MTDPNRVPIQAPLAAPPRYGIVAACPVIDTDPPQLLVDGWEMLPEMCGDGEVDCVNCTGLYASMDPDVSRSGIAQPSLAVGDPFMVYALDRCSAIGFEAHDYDERARRQLAATESYVIAREFWQGFYTLWGGCGADNIPLRDPSSDRLTPFPLVATTTALDGLGLLEYGLGQCNMGRQGMIHCTTQALTHLAASYAITRQGNLWVTAMGNIVVADAGYDGSGPGGIGGMPGDATQYMYATSLVTLRMGPVQMLGGKADLRSGLERTQNTITTYALRPVAIVWDHCCHLTVEISLPIPLIGGAS